MKMRWLLCLISLSLLLGLLLCPSVALAENGEAEAPKQILSDAQNIFSSIGLQKGGATCHGNNQTRIAYTSTGIYFSCPLEEEYEQSTKMDKTHYALWRINFDGSIDMLIEDYFYYVAAGTTTNVMVDKDENIWITCSWDEGAGFYELVAWKYDVKADSSQKFAKTGFYRFGGMYGKPIGIIDPEYNRIYQCAFFGEKSPAHMIWAILDLETGEWSDIYHVKATTSCYYHFAYPDGQGGFYFLTERANLRANSYTDIPDVRGNIVVSQLHSHKIDANFFWDEAHFFHVPDATVEKANDIAVIDAVYNVRNGCYPNVTNVHNDIFLDESTGYLYMLICLEDNGKPGIENHLVVMDTNQPDENGIFKILSDTVVTYEYGGHLNYEQKLYRDAEGNLYIIAVPTSRGVVEIWHLDDPLGKHRSLICEEFLHGDADGHKLSDVYGLNIASNRNNSKPSDEAHLALWEYSVSWVYFTIDFAAVRALMK